MQNKETIAKYAPVVFWAGVIVILLGAIVIASNAFSGSGRGPVPPEYMLLGGLLLIAVSGLMNPNAVRGALGLRTVRQGGNALLITIAFLAILGVLNYLGTQSRFEYRQDFSANQQFTISPQTTQILQSLKQPVKVTAFFSAAAAGRTEADDRLKEYRLRGGDKFTYEFVDTDQRPDLARSLGVTRDGGIIFESGTKKQEAISSSEQDFTTAILKVTTDSPHAIVFISGHKERDVADSAQTGLSSLKQWLEKDNYTVTTLNTLITTTLPASTTALVLASPQITLTAGEVTMLSDYLDQGGRLLVTSDPSLPAPAAALLEKWGVSFDNDEAYDPKFLQGTTPLAPLADSYPFSTITQKMTGAVTIFPLARSLQQKTSPTSTLTIQPVVQTSAQSWGETTLDTSIPPQYEEGKDVKGPLNLALSIEGAGTISGTAAARKTRIVAFGNSRFVANDILQAQQLNFVANVDLFMNSINWLAEDESLISIRPTPTETRTVTMTAQQQSLVFLLSVVVVPALVFIGGFSVWWKRR